MKPKSSVLIIKLLTLQNLQVLCLPLKFDYFYFVQQWPGSLCCSSKYRFCYPPTGKPNPDFYIHGLWPNRKHGKNPTFCNPSSHFSPSKVTNLVSSLQVHWPSLTCPSNNGETFWSHEWQKHGTCTKPTFDQERYFNVALQLKVKANLLQTLRSVGIEPDGQFYSRELIKHAIERGFGHTPGIRCRDDELGNSQLYQIYLCVDTSGSKIIECPRFPSSGCGSKIMFPSF